MCTGAKTVHGNSNGFEVQVSMHQGALSPLLFVIFMEALF